MDNNNTHNDESLQQKVSKNKKVKKSGIIRWNAIIPLVIFILLIGLYFTFLFDGHMKKAIEWGGYKALGVEVNLAAFKSSFTNGSVQLIDLQITNGDQPDYNSIEIGDIRFGLNWDALLRLKFVVKEMAVEKIQFMSKRKYRGKVAPPEPPSNGPSFTDQLKNKALDKVASQNGNNLLGDLAAFLKTGDYKAQLSQMESRIKSKQLAQDLKLKWESKQKIWDQQIKALPNEKDFKNYKTEFESIKYKDFKTPQELQISVDKFNNLKKDVEAKVKMVDDTKKSFTDDLAAIKKDYQTLDQQIKEDIATIKDHLKIPKIDANQIANSIFMDYLTPYIHKLDRVNALAEKYLPPKYSKLVNENLNSKVLLSSGKNKKVDPKDDDTIQPLPRAKGVSYEFPITTGYPLFWIQKVSISSKSNAQADYGDLSGVITNIVSNQRQIQKQTELKVSGDLKSQNVLGLKLSAYLNNLKDEPAAGLNVGVASYPLSNIELLNSPDGQLSIPSASIGMNISAATEGFKFYKLKLENTFNNVNFDLNAKEKIVDEILKNTFAQLKSFDLTAKAEGELKSLTLDVSSSLGSKIQDALSASVQQKINELNSEIKTKIDQEIGKAREQIDKQITTLTKGYVTSASDIQNKLNGQKNMIDEKINTAKKDLENKAKNKAEEEGKKALDSLKKKLKF